MHTLLPFRLRRWQKDDEKSLVKYANNYNIWRNVRDSFPHPYTYQNAEEWLALCQGEVIPTVFAIEVENEAVGGVGIVLQQDVYRKSAEIGYWLGEPFWGHGIASAATAQLCEYAFSSFDLHRLYAGVFAYNKSSMRVLEKAGFALESVQKQAVCKENTLFDSHLYVKLKPKMDKSFDEFFEKNP